MVEFALVAPVFLILVFGIIDFGLTLNNFNSVRQGVREGAREAVVAAWSDSCAGTTNEKARCLTRERIGLDDAKTRVRIALPGTYAVGEELKVCAMYPAESTTGFFGALLSGKVLTSEITMRIEKIDEVDALSASQDTPLSGEDWSWC